jgi:hypothetical protein
VESHKETYQELKDRLSEYKFKGLKRIARELKNKGYSKLNSEKLVEFILNHNTKESIQAQLGIERNRRKVLKLRATVITVPVAVLTFWFVLYPLITKKNDQSTYESYLTTIPTDTFEITPFPEPHLLINGTSEREEPDYTGIRILEDHRAYDFRRSIWLDSSNVDPFASPVIMRRRVKIAKDERCNELTMRFSTSGSAISARCVGQAFKFWTPTKLVPNHFENKLMKSIDVIVDLSYGKPIDTLDFVFEVTYFNGFQNRKREWMGGSVLGTSIAQKTTLRTFFSEERHPENFEVCGHKAYDTTCHTIANVRILPSIKSYDFGWLLFADDSLNFLDGIDTKWNWAK